MRCIDLPIITLLGIAVDLAAQCKNLQYNTTLQ